MSKILGLEEGVARRRMKKLGLIVPPDIIQKFKEESYIKKGDVPFNKDKKQQDFMSPEAIEKTKATRFKKGEIAPNKKHFKDGDITIRAEKLRDGSIRNYKWIRIARAKWRMVHVVNWEKQHGPVPEGCIVVFKNKDTMNCDVSNLEMITLEENMARNTIHNYPTELKTTIRLLSKVNKKIRNAKKQD